MNESGIVADGARRLRKAIEAEARRQYEQGSAVAPNFWRRMMIREKIKNEVKRRMESVASPHSLYSSTQLFTKFPD
jgi:hypothetical protein